MKLARTTGLAVLLVSLATIGGHASAPRNDKLTQALAEVRSIKADIHSRQSSVLGTLAGPEEMAAHMMRCRPIPQPQAGLKRELDFNAQTIARAKSLDPMALRKKPGRFGNRVLPLDITGAYVCEFINRVELMVVHVLDDSPAAGRLKVDDIIIGANGRLFTDTEDPRPEMGNALCESQTPQLGGILTLHVVRDRKPINVRIDLGSTLPYSPTWPFHCEKTRQIRQAALRYVIDTYPWDRRDFWTPLFLMASGDDQALELARRHLCADLKDQYPQGRGGSTWNTSYELINLCEYYLLTGDSSVLPAIRYKAQNLAWAQYRSGSWSHGGGGAGVPGPGMVDGGYGEINCAGLGAFIGLCLARQCGIEPYDHTLPRSVRFFGKFCGTNFPYGLGNPGNRGGRMDNGMNAMAAIAFHLLGEDDMAQRWARTVCYMWMGRERGHAEAIFSAAWGPVGAALAPAPEFHAFMNHMKWAYEMGRSREGKLTFMRGGRWVDANMTAAMGLFLYLPEHRLQILGGDSVFAHRPPPGLEKAAQLYRDKQWKALEQYLRQYLAGQPASPAHKDYAEKLLQAYRRLEQHASATLKIIERSIRNEQWATAALQLDLLKKMLGEERPPAAALRAKLPEGKPKNKPRPRPQPLVDVKAVTQSLRLASGGIDNGFACSPGYITGVYKQGFEGMSPEQIARFFNHPCANVIDAAALALAQRGADKVMPLLKRLLKDTHPGVRSAALATMSELYRYDSDEYRTEVPAELEQIIKLAQALTRDPHPVVRNAATGLMLSMKVINDDVCQVLREMARIEGSHIDHVVRYGIKDPVLRTELAMELINTANRTKSKVPSDYKPLNWAVGAHLEHCGPYVQTAIDTLNNPEVVTLYGFFSQGPPNMSLKLLFAYSDNPLVLEHLPDVLRFGVRRRGGYNSYWMPCTEYPHRLVIKLGPKAIDKVEQFAREERALYQRIASGQEPQPVWWQEDSPQFLEQWIADLQETVEIVRCLYGQRTLEQSVDTLCRIYLKNRPWGPWERQQIRDYLTRQGVKVVPLLRRITAASPDSGRAALEQQIAEKKAEIEALKNAKEKQRKSTALEPMLDRLQRYKELVELADLIEALNAPAPTDKAVETMCRFYVKRPLGKAYPFTQADTDDLRAYDQTQLALIRDTLQRWGKPVLPMVRRFLQADRPVLERALAQLDKDQQYWEGQRARLRGKPLARIARERQDIQEIRAELEDLCTLIECTGRANLSEQQVGRLCRIFTLRHWPAQNRAIDGILSGLGAEAVPVIRQHIQAERRLLPQLQAVIDKDMTKTSSMATKWRYDKTVARKKRIVEGTARLQAIADQLAGTARVGTAGGAKRPVARAAALAPPTGGRAQPNILFILADDCTYNVLGCYGGRDVPTPNIDRLARQGMRFTRAYCAIAMCAPFRTELYTGLYPMRSGSTRNHTSGRPETRSVVDYLGALGYRVGLAGKKHVHFPFVRVKDLPDGPGVRAFMTQDKTQPFCLFLCSHNPHAPWTNGDPSRIDPAKIHLAPVQHDNSPTRQAMRRYLAEVADLDREVGAALDLLEQTGLADQTLVMFSSEQGWPLGFAKWSNWDLGVHTALLVRWPGHVKPGTTTDALVQMADVLPTLIEAAGGDPADYDLDGRGFLAVLIGRATRHRTYVYGMHNNVPEGRPYPIRYIQDEHYHYIMNLTPEAAYHEKHVMAADSRLVWWPALQAEAERGDEQARRLMQRYRFRPAEELYRVDEDPYELNNLAGDPAHAQAKQRLRTELLRWMARQKDPGAALDVEAERRPS